MLVKSSELKCDYFSRITCMWMIIDYVLSSANVSSLIIKDRVKIFSRITSKFHRSVFFSCIYVLSLSLCRSRFSLTLIEPVMLMAFVVMVFLSQSYPITTCTHIRASVLLLLLLTTCWWDEEENLRRFSFWIFLLRLFSFRTYSYSKL